MERGVIDLAVNQHDTFEYLLPARRLTGTRCEVLAQIDEVMQGLAGLRQLVSQQDSGQRSIARVRRLRLVGLLGAAAFLMGAAAIASAQSGVGTAAGGPSETAVQAGQPPEPRPFEHVKFGVALETYYQFNWNRPPDRSLPLRAYDTRGNSFSIQQAAFVFKSNHVAAILKPAPVVTWVVNYYFGQEQPDGGAPGGPDGFFTVFDTNVVVAPTPALSFALDANYVTNEVNRADPSLSLQGTAVYARYQLNGVAALGLRYERLDEEGLFGGIDQVLHEATITGEYKVADGFLVRAEFRRDSSNVAYFPGRGGASDPRRQQNTALLGGVWWFGNKAGAW